MNILEIKLNDLFNTVLHIDTVGNRQVLGPRPYQTTYIVAVNTGYGGPWHKAANTWLAMADATGQSSYNYGGDEVVEVVCLFTSERAAKRAAEALQQEAIGVLHPDGTTQVILI